MSDEPSERLSRVEDMVSRRILSSRIIMLDDSVDEDSARDVIRKIWYLELSEPGKDILLAINSPGGSVTCGLAIWDHISMISSPVTTLVLGLAASMASVLSLVGGKGRRFASPKSRIMMHQPRIQGTITGQATDIEIQAEEIKRIKTLLIQIYVEATGKDFKTVEKDIDRDNWMTPEQAIEYGLLDGIIESYSHLSGFFEA